MGRIRLSRVVVGGLVAGTLLAIAEYTLNASILATGWQTAMLALGRPDSTNSARAMALFMGSTLVIGVSAVWLYAAIRPRFGSGPQTALRAGMVLWVVAYLVPALAHLALDLWPERLTLVGLVLGLPEILIATLAGAWLYKER